MAEIAEDAGVAAPDSADGETAGAGDLVVAGDLDGRGWDSGAGIRSFMTPGGGAAPGSDTATMHILIITSMVILAPGITLQTTIRPHPRNKTIKTIKVIKTIRMATGSRQTGRALRPRKIPRTWPFRS